MFDALDRDLFFAGLHTRLYEKLGAHLAEGGVHFAVWAPNAPAVYLIGDFNLWDPEAHPLSQRSDGSGIWETFIPGLQKGALYKYRIGNLNKADPFAFYAERSPQTASVVWDLEYSWRSGKIPRSDPIAIYEVHCGSWKMPCTYLEMAAQLPVYVKMMGFTHVEFLPIMEHPFYGSWGYQTVGYFSPTSRYGSPQEFMMLIDALHQEGIGVILDWVPSHFPSDPYGLAAFDGTCLYEYADPQKGVHPDWNSLIFDYTKPQVRSFLISSALFWLKIFQADALRMDAIASMLYLNYSRQPGSWQPNERGGAENLEAVAFLQDLNHAIHAECPEALTIAEESTAWPQVTGRQGLDFSMKWNMGWMHDTLHYMYKDPSERPYYHNDLLFSMVYAFSEKYVLPLSHDEVVHEKGSLWAKMPGDEWRKFAQLRLLLGYQYFHPGKKLLFMGQEFAQIAEWHHEESLHWHLLTDPFHRGIQKWVQDLNTTYCNESALHQREECNQCFEWEDISDAKKSTISFFRHGTVLVVCNFSVEPVCKRVGVDRRGLWKELLNSDSIYYGGSNVGNLGAVSTEEIPLHGKAHSLAIMVPPLGVVCFK